MPTVTRNDVPRTPPLGIAATVDRIESMAAPVENNSSCFTKLFQCIACPFIALWNWLCGCCCSSDTDALTAPLEQPNLFDRRFNNLYNSLLEPAQQPEWKEAIVVSKNGQAIFSQLEKRSRDTVDNFKNQTIQKLKSALENQEAAASCDITMMLVEEDSNKQRYSTVFVKSVLEGPNIGLERYSMRGAKEERVQEIINGNFNQEEIEPLTEFFF